MRRYLRAAAALVLTSAAGAGVPDPHLPGPRIDTVAPVLPPGLARGILIVSKTGGWRHVEHIPHSNAVLADIARGLGRPAYVTENAAVFDDALLRRFAVVVLNSASGPFLTDAQAGAFARFVARGGGVVALHAAGDDSHRDPWYVATIVGTRFTGHPGGADHIQRARIVVDRPRHPVMADVRLPWSPADEWYSFAHDPASQGMEVLARIDEASYRPAPGQAMGRHPVVWVNPRTRGRVVYSALGHTPEAYDDPNYRRLLTNALRWAARRG